MNEIKRNATEFASSVTKKVIKMSKSNAGYKKTVKISDDLRIRFDGAVILDDDESGLIINLYLDKKYDRFFDNIKMHHSGFVKSDRKSVFADFHHALLDIINEWIEEVVYKELDKVVETFNNYVKEQVDEEYTEASAELDDCVIDMEDPENPSTEMDWDWNIKDMWVDWCYLNTQIDMDYVFDYFEKHREQFMNEDDICDYINEMYGDYVDDNCSGSCLIYKYTPEQWDEFLNSLNINAVKNDAPMLDRDTEIMTKNDTPLLDVVNDIVNAIWINLMPLGYTEGQKIDWGFFENGTKEYCFKHGAEVYDRVVKAVPQISDALAYDDCFYVWYDEEYPKIVKEKMEMETRVYEIVEELCDAMEDGKMIEYGDYMIGLQFSEDGGYYSRRKPEWWQSMVFVIKKEDIDENGYYDLDECGECFCFECYFNYIVELLRGDVDVVGQIRDDVVWYIKNNRVYNKVA